MYTFARQQCEAIYIGETSRSLKKRTQEHAESIEVNYEVTLHMRALNPTFKFDRVKIVDREQNDPKRNISESFFINRGGNNINNKTNTFNLSNPYVAYLKAYHISRRQQQ